MPCNQCDTEAKCSNLGLCQAFAHQMLDGGNQGAAARVETFLRGIGVDPHLSEQAAPQLVRIVRGVEG